MSINRRPVSASTLTRDGIVRSVNRGGQYWRFEVTMPNGMRWTDWRTKIQEIETLGCVTAGSFTLNNTGLSWLVKYLGDATSLTNTFRATWTKYDTSFTLSASPTLTTGQFKFRIGDFIQLGPNGRVYNVVEDVAHNSNIVKVHRPIIDASNVNPAAINLNIGPACSFTVQCYQMPKWTLMARDQVSWDTPFILVEKIVNE
jgi:hypothetical protein